ncbi:type II toxin-antitoxin system RelE/ParE family toxin [Pseudomonas sp. NPDC090592]|uniref:type II toxin-antitoxin system RelE/ParE family toxin n=1 Tax=Pseudomonas sp. NPDC090592 TaxID=3364480 RepID=UPI00383B3B85
MLFTETALFTKRVKELLDDDAYRLLQVRLMISPEAGDLIEGTGGLRKLRVAANGHGKRGGARVIYYHFTARSQIAMLYIYRKNDQPDLSTEQRKALRSIIEHWRHA